jgi:hypothetical protein
MPKLGDHDEIFPSSQNFVHGGKLPGKAYRLPHAVGL